MNEALRIDPRVTLPASDFTWTAVRASGPGGQNVNKVASKIELRFDFETSTALTEPIKARLRTLARTRLDGEGRILVVSQRFRDQAKNLDDARDKVRALVLEALTPKPPRKATKPSRASKLRRLDEKRRASEKKKARRGDT